MSSIKEGVTVTIQRLHEKRGGVTAAQLVRAAQPKSSPAHDGFEWDDTLAGEQFRLVQSRNWLKVVRIKHGNREEPLYHVPPAPDERVQEGVYRARSVLIRIPDQLERAISQCIATLHAARLPGLP